MNIKGQKNDPVELGTLIVGDWYERNFDYTNDYECLYPSCIVRFDNMGWAKAKSPQDWDHSDPPHALVHPLTKIGDEFWYRGSEPNVDGQTEFGRIITINSILEEHAKRLAALESREQAEPVDDIRPIGELPVGTVVRYIKGSLGPYGSLQNSDDLCSEDRFVGSNRDTLLDGDGLQVEYNIPPDYKLRVIRYPDPKPERTDITLAEVPVGRWFEFGSSRCKFKKLLAEDANNNAQYDDGFLTRFYWTNQPCTLLPADFEPEPTYLERLPQALREFLSPAKHAGIDIEALARKIWESRDATFVAGEPLETLKLKDVGFRDSVHACNVQPFEDGKYFGLSGAEAEKIKNPDALRFARRTAAIALREGGAAIEHITEGSKE